MTKRVSQNLQGWIKTPPETHPSGFNFRNINKILKAFLKHSWGLFSRNTWMPLPPHRSAILYTQHSGQTCDINPDRADHKKADTSLAVDGPVPS